MQTFFLPYHVCKQLTLSFQTLQTIFFNIFHTPFQENNGPSLPRSRTLAFLRLLYKSHDTKSSVLTPQIYIKFPLLVYAVEPAVLRSLL